MGADRHAAHSDSVSARFARSGPKGSSPGELPGKPQRAAGSSASAPRQTEFFSLRRGKRFEVSGRFWHGAGLIAIASVRGEVRV